MSATTSTTTEPSEAIRAALAIMQYHWLPYRERLNLARLAVGLPPLPSERG